MTTLGAVVVNIFLKSCYNELCNKEVELYHMLKTFMLYPKPCYIESCYNEVEVFYSPSCYIQNCIIMNWFLQEAS